MAGLGRPELILYVVGWTGAVLYSMYQVHLACDKYSRTLSRDLEPGWKWVGRKVDTADYEWKTWTPILLDWLKFVIIHLLVSQVLRQVLPRALPIFSIAVSLAWLWSTLGLPVSLMLLLQPVIFIIIHQLLSIKAVWAVCLSITLALHSSYLSDLKELIFEDQFAPEEYLFSVLLAWTHARSISYIVDTSNRREDDKSVVKCYHFCFYLPLLPSGPLVLYRDFEESAGKLQTWNRTSFLKGSALVLRYIFWWFFNQLALHYFYHSALQYNPELVRRLDIWSAAGLGYSLGQFFMLKYIVLYGLPSALARLDQVDAPPPPKCIGRIHLYSQMWRDFDRGLYNFMLRYIYIPWKASHDGVWSALAGSALCFTFVAVWHGASTAVVIWSVANYLGVCLEMGAKSCATLSPFAHWKETWSEASWLRFQAAIASPLLLMSALSNFCFFTDANVGYILAHKAVVEGGVIRLGWILLAMYCCCHVSMAVSRLSSSSTTNTKRHDHHQHDQ